jgi:hypothetical protein
MHIQNLFRSIRGLMAFAAMTLLASCGGGGSDCHASSLAFGSIGGAICKKNQTEVSTTISGVAAAGAPIIGNVEIMDSLGVKRGAPIQDDGTYQVDVSGMNGPFIVKASGSIAGVSVTYYSAATQADVGGTINVTPFTDLLLSNIAGKWINQYLSDESKIPEFASNLPPKKIGKAQDALFAMLRPILIQLGVTETIDLIRTLFKADHSGVDALMDLVKVEYSTDENVAILRNVITRNKMVEIDLTQPIPLTPIPPTNYEDIDVSAANDVKEIGAVLKRLENLFASGLPTPEILASSGVFDTSDDFTQGGASFKQFVDEVSTEPELVGLRFKWSLYQLDPGRKATIFAKIILKNDNTYSPDSEVLVLRKVAGSWRYGGDNQIASIDFKNEHALELNLNSQLVNISTPQIRNGIRFNIDPFAYNNSGKNSPRIESAEITGSGINNVLEFRNSNPDVAMRIVSPALTDGNALWDCASALLLQPSLPCLNLQAVNISEPYKIVLKNASGQALNGAGYNVPLDRVPLAFNQLTPTQFVNITAVKVNDAPLSAAAFGPNKSMRVEFKVPGQLQINHVLMNTMTQSGIYIRQDYSVPPGARSAVFGWGNTLSNGTVSSVYLRITAYSEFGYKFVTTARISVPQN